MIDKNQTTDLSYYGLYLLKYLKENHPNKAADTDFIESRADHAADVYEQSRLEGYTPEGAQELAMAALTEGLHFSKYNTIIEVLWNEFGDEVEPGNAPAFALTLQPEMEEVFARYPLTDNFSDTAIPAALGKESEHSFHSLARNFAYTSEYDLLYTELTGAVATYLEEHGV